MLVLMINSRYAYIARMQEHFLPHFQLLVLHLSIGQQGPELVSLLHHLLQLLVRQVIVGDNRYLFQQSLVVPG